MIAFTIDIDWAPDEVIADTIKLFEQYGVKATLFATHFSQEIAQQNRNNFEIGIHPNFNHLLFGDTKQGNVDNVLAEIMEIYPEAKGVRSHSMTQSTGILDKFTKQGLVYDANQFLPYFRGLKPFRSWTGIIQILYNWEDDIHWCYGKNFNDCELDLEDSGLNIFDFHPIHVYLNTENQRRYDHAKSYYKDPKKLLEYRNRTSIKGTRDLLISVLEYIHSILNAHFGDLPRYKGNAAINWALLQHEPSVTLTIHFMEAGELDSGDIVAQKSMLLTDTTTVKDILEFAERQVPKMFLNTLNSLKEGTCTFKKQYDSKEKSFRCYPRIPSHSKIDWFKPAKDIHALVRASTHPYSGAYTYLSIKGQLKKVWIWESRVVTPDTCDIGVPGHLVRHDPCSGETWVHTGQGLLALRKIQYHDTEIFEPGKVWKSIRMTFGIDIEDEIIAIHKICRREPTNVTSGDI